MGRKKSLYKSIYYRNCQCQYKSDTKIFCSLYVHAVKALFYNFDDPNTTSSTSNYCNILLLCALCTVLSSRSSSTSFLDVDEDFVFVYVVVRYIPASFYVLRIQKGLSFWYWGNVTLALLHVIPSGNWLSVINICPQSLRLQLHRMI